MQKGKGYDYEVKLVMLGNSGVGKTSIIAQFSKNQFPETVQTSIYTDFVLKDISIEGKKLQAQVWDTAGQERYRVVTRAYYRDTAGVLLVYDITDYQSFLDVEVWVKELSDYMDIHTLPLVLLGNKSDRTEERKVTLEQGQQLASKYTWGFLETSAKTAANVETAFLTLLGQVYHSKIQGVAHLPQGVQLRRESAHCKLRDLPRPGRKCC